MREARPFAFGDCCEAGETYPPTRRPVQASATASRHLRGVIPDGVPSPFPDGAKACPACTSGTLTYGRPSATEVDQVDLFACESCGEFWFERDGLRLTADAMRRLGLIP